jgi:uncharacterized protein YndB with AHSA1/START domain
VIAKRYHVSRHIDAPVERVWALLTDASRYRAWNRAVVSIEGPITEGAEWRPRPDGTGTPTLTRLLTGCATIPGMSEYRMRQRCAVRPA